MVTIPIPNPHKRQHHQSTQVRALSKAMADELAAAGTIAEERVANIRAVRALGNDALEVARCVRVLGGCGGVEGRGGDLGCG